MVWKSWLRVNFAELQGLVYIVWVYTFNKNIFQYFFPVNFDTDNNPKVEFYDISGGQAERAGQSGSNRAGHVTVSLLVDFLLVLVVVLR